MYLENLNNNTFTFIAPFNLSGDIMIDSENLRDVFSFNFNLWSDDEMTNLLATSEI